MTSKGEVFSHNSMSDTSLSKNINILKVMLVGTFAEGTEGLIQGTTHRGDTKTTEPRSQGLNPKIILKPDVQTKWRRLCCTIGHH